MSNPKSIAPDGNADGGFYAVTAAGHLISAKALKDGQRWATAEDVAKVTEIEAKRAKAEKAANVGPLKGRDAMPKQGRNRGQVTAEGQTDLAAGDVAIGAGWGTTGTKAITSGSNDVAGQIVVTASGASFAQATATVVITFKSAYAAAPRTVIATTTNDNSIDTGHVTWSATTTALTLTFSVLPVDTKIYKINYLVVA